MSRVVQETPCRSRLRLLGHADTTVTRREYAHAYERANAAGVTAFANAVLG
jgi:hypothetical protein